MRDIAVTLEESLGQRWFRLPVSGFDVRFFLRGPMLDAAHGKGAASRAALAPILGEPSLLITPKQVHGTTILETGAENTVSVQSALSGAVPDVEADGILFGAREAAEIGTEASLRFADCAPVLVAPSRQWVNFSGAPWVLMLHSGYKGTVLNIVEAGLEKARIRYGTDALEGAWAWVGPCIGGANYPRDRDEWTLRGLETFSKTNVKSSGEKVYFDIAGELKLQLADADIAEDRVVLSGVDTCERPDICYSYRSGDRDARMCMWAARRFS